ncbi:hypothetical protein DY000_02032640 [Brassica cretica]|uniref:REJ domain-containing protein n=1 Tax=Brassica cretica TaxID=69181 RepID=A0ABQ7DHW3_BRACR|nr:hypothetical protein DY000_02032640 [Brassica cretica]
MTVSMGEKDGTQTAAASLVKLSSAASPVKLSVAASPVKLSAAASLAKFSVSVSLVKLLHHVSPVKPSAAASPTKFFTAVSPLRIYVIYVETKGLLCSLSMPPSSLLDTSVISRRDASVISPRRLRDLSWSSDASVISQTPPL